MSSLGRFYVLGPPVQYADNIIAAVQDVMKRTPDLTAAPFTLNDVQGPVRYDSGWVPGGKRKILRQGMEVADLWTGQVLWNDPFFVAGPFSVVVIDQEYIVQMRGRRQQPPGFETFVVGVLHGDTAGVDRLYEWRTNGKRDWRNRGQWLGSLGVESDRLRRQSLEPLSKCPWNLLHDLDNLFAAAGAPRASRRERGRFPGRTVDFRETHSPPRRNVFIPF